MNRRILQLAVPSILANITIPLVGVVDTAIVGHISDASAIGGIAIGTMLFDLLYWNFGFLRVGTSGMTAQAFGRGDRKECTRLLTQSLGIVGIATMAIWVLQWLFVTAVLACVPCSPEVASFAREYFFVRIWAAPATLSLLAMKGWFIGMQDTVSPMAVDILVNVVNMVVSYVLAVHTPLGPIGVAYGTLVAQYSGLVLAVMILWLKYHLQSTRAELRAALRWDRMRRLMQLNGNLFIRSLCFMVVYVGFTSLASKYGDTELAVSAILMKLFMLFSYFVDGFAFAGEALVGRYIGERAPQMTRRAVRLLFNWSLGVGLIFTAVYALWGDDCIRLITTDMMVIDWARPYMAWLIAMPIVSTLAFMWDGVYVGATAGIQIRNSMIWAAVAFVGAYLACYRWIGVQAIYVAYFAHLLARVVYLSIQWKPLFNSIQQDA
ncbi:MAG: MATE family efflux transporter [Paludibacteraceae bacterium]|nr:MATE family efflux transporter [Paludibacteraceae bacterium]